jgi:hypothetical protein
MGAFAYMRRRRRSVAGMATAAVGARRIPGMVTALSADVKRRADDAPMGPPCG